MRLFLLPLGVCRVDKGIALTPGTGDGETVLTPIWAGLLDTPVGWVLVDTGMNAVHVTDPEVTFRGTRYAGAIQPIMTSDDVILHRLGQVGVQPTEIRYVINSHLHFDHCGGNLWFPSARFLIQRAEYENAVSSPGEFFARDFAVPNLSYDLLDGPHRLAPGIDIVPTPGHTPGHQSVLARLDTRRVILPGDAVVLREVLEGVQGAWHDPGRGRESVKLLRQLAEHEEAEILATHDQAAWFAWPHAPQPFV